MSMQDELKAIVAAHQTTAEVEASICSAIDYLDELEATIDGQEAKIDELERECQRLKAAQQDGE